MNGVGNSFQGYFDGIYAVPSEVSLSTIEEPVALQLCTLFLKAQKQLIKNGVLNGKRVSSPIFDITWQKLHWCACEYAFNGIDSIRSRQRRERITKPLKIDYALRIENDSLEFKCQDQGEGIGFITAPLFAGNLSSKIYLPENDRIGSHGMGLVSIAHVMNTFGGTYQAQPRIDDLGAIFLYSVPLAAISRNN